MGRLNKYLAARYIIGLVVISTILWLAFCGQFLAAMVAAACFVLGFAVREITALENYDP